MSAKYKTFDEYADTLSDIVKEKLYELRDIILTVHPDAEEVFSYGVPAFTLVKGGKKDERIVVGGFKNHVGLYPNPNTIVYFAEELKGYKTSTSTIQFPVNEELPKDLIERIIKHTKDMLENR